LDSASKDVGRGDSEPEEMMNSSWIKLYRKLLNNKELLRDHTGLAVFIWLLLRADYKTGKVETGRFVASQDLGMNPNTFYKALTRLRNRKMVTQSSNNRFTTISITNWHQFQGTGNSGGNNKVTTGQQQSNTIKEVKKLRNKELETVEYLQSESCYQSLYKTFPNIDERAIQKKCSEFYDYCLSKDRTYKNYLAAVRGAIRRDQDKLQKKVQITQTPIREEISEEQRQRNLKTLAEIRGNIG